MNHDANGIREDLMISACMPIMLHGSGATPFLVANVAFNLPLVNYSDRDSMYDRLSRFR